jgi:hypothetical protein
MSTEDTNNNTNNNACISNNTTIVKNSDTNISNNSNNSRSSSHSSHSNMFQVTMQHTCQLNLAIDALQANLTEEKDTSKNELAMLLCCGCCVGCCHK